jgi:hypothetical protein
MIVLLKTTFQLAAQERAAAVSLREYYKKVGIKTGNKIIGVL